MQAVEKIRNVIASLPSKPGVYQFSDAEGKVIYVGKAKNLKNRVSSYFTKNIYENAKTKLLVRKVSDLQYFVVASEYEALLLENSMIKEYQPRYNIQLKDDKTYPFICVRKERFPRIFSTRHIVRDGSDYYGPYASVRLMNTMLELIRQLYPLRTCSYDLSEKNIAARKFKVCLEFHVKNCLGPCEELQSEADYNESVDDIKSILQGNISQVITHLKDKMNRLSSDLEFEKAEIVKDKLDNLKKFRGKSTVVSPDIRDLDVFSFVEDGDSVFVNFLKVNNGAIVQGHTVDITKKMGENAEDVFLMGLIELRQRFGSASKEIVVPLQIEIEIPGVRWTLPIRGDKKKLLELSERNAKTYRADKLRRLEKTDPKNYQEKILDQIMTDLGLKERPTHIECFDNSNIQGKSAVAACVVFRNGKPSRKEYRHFNIRTVEGPDDFASMREITLRRYKRIMEEGKELPQLIVIDGGKGQLGAAMESLEELSLREKISVIGIAKKLEEIYKPDDPTPLYLSKKSETLKVIQHIRNEAHRFGINFHRDKRSREMLDGSLLSIPGIGEETEKSLLRRFKSVKRIREASLEDLEEVIGKKRANVLHRHLHQLN